MGKIEVDRAEKIKLWADRLKPFLEKETEVFGYFSKHYSGHSPSDAKTLLGIIGTDL